MAEQIVVSRAEGTPVFKIVNGQKVKLGLSKNWTTIPQKFPAGCPTWLGEVAVAPNLVAALKIHAFREQPFASSSRSSRNVVAAFHDGEGSKTGQETFMYALIPKLEPTANPEGIPIASEIWFSTEPFPEGEFQTKFDEIDHACQDNGGAANDSGTPNNKA